MLQKTDENGENGGTEEENPLEFPVTNLYELEGRVFAEHWSIPYKKEESLGKCLIAATRLAEASKLCMYCIHYILFNIIPSIFHQCLAPCNFKKLCSNMPVECVGLQ